MKVLIINGSPNKNGNTAIALKEMVKVFEAEGVQTETVCVGNLPVRGCIGCRGCMHPLHPIQPRTGKLPTHTVSVCTPSASKTLTISLRAIAVFPFLLGLPLIINTFIFKNLDFCGI